MKFFLINRAVAAAALLIAGCGTATSNQGSSIPREDQPMYAGLPLTSRSRQELSDDERGLLTALAGSRDARPRFDVGLPSEADLTAWGRQLSSIQRATCRSFLSSDTDTPEQQLFDARICVLTTLEHDDVLEQIAVRLASEDPDGVAAFRQKSCRLRVLSFALAHMALSKLRSETDGASAAWATATERAAVRIESPRSGGCAQANAAR